MKRLSGGIVRLVFGLALVAGIVGVTPLHAASSGSITMNATAGLDGWVRPGGWLPIDVDLTNEGADVDARVVVDSGSGQSFPGKGSIPFRTEYAVDTSLPRHSHKLLHLDVPFDNRQSNLSVRLTDGRDTLREAQVTPAILETNQLLVGVLSEHPPQSLQGLFSLGTTNRRTIVPVFLNAGSFPSHPESFGSLDLLIVDGYPTMDLNDGQRQALRDWISQGGALIAVGGGDWHRTLAGLPTGLLPVAVRSDVPLDASDPLARLAGLASGPSGSVGVSQANVRDGQVIAEVGSVPVVVVARRGLGSVTFLAMDPLVDPIASWTGAPRLWRAILAEALPSDALAFPSRGTIVSRDLAFLNQMTGALSNFPSLDPPSLHTLALVLLGYVLLIGFGSYFVLGRLRKRELAWVSTPAIALVFVLGTYWIARHARGSDVVVSTVSLVRLDSLGQGTAFSAVGAFASGDSGSHLTLDSPAFFLSLPESPGGPITSATTASPSTPVAMTIYQGDHEQSLELAAAAPWSLRGIWSRQSFADVGKIDATLRPEGQHLRGVVTNHTRFPLDDCVLLVGNDFVRLGKLPVGGTATVDLSLSAIAAPPVKGPSGIYQVYNWLPVNQSVGQPVPATAADEATRADYARKQPVFLAWAQAAPALGGRGDEPIYFVGWSDQRLVSVNEAGRPALGPSLDLIAQPLDLDFAAGFDLAAGLHTGRVVDLTGASSSTEPSGLRLDHGTATLEFVAPRADRLQSLGLHVSTFANGIQSRPSFGVEVFDWSSGTWQKLSASAIARSLTSTAPPTSLRNGAPVAIPAPLPATGIGQVQVSIAQVGVAPGGGAYDVSFDSLPLAKLVGQSGLVRVRLSAPDSSLLLGQVSLTARGSP